MSTKVSDSPGVTLATYLSPADAQMLRARAAAADRSVAAELRRLIRAGLKNDERRPARAGAVKESAEDSDGRGDEG